MARIEPRRRAGGLALVLLPWAGSAAAATLRVGPGQPFAKPCDAIAAAAAGDVIEVDAAGDYTGDYCSWSTDDLTVRGVNGRAKIDNRGLATSVAGEKGIFTIEPPAQSVTIENFELAGASIGASEGNNGAGIRHQIQNLTVRGCYLHDNQDGILGAPPTAGTGTVLVEFSEFARNGAGDGYSHNLYLGDYGTVIVQYCYSHEANIGHLLKSRGLVNYILYNFLADLPGGTSSYELDLPQGGLSFVIGNAIEQSQTGASQGNSNIVSYAEESRANPSQQLFFIANTVVNDAATGTFLKVGGSPEVTSIDNVFHGPGTIVSGGGTLLQSHDWTDAQGNPLLADPAAYDYELLPGSPCIGAGIDPGASDGGVALEPVAEYLLDAGAITRDNARWDIGAFEYGDDGGPAAGGFPVPDGGSGGSSGSTSGGTGSSGGGSTSSSSSSGTPAGGSSGGSAAAGGSGSDSGSDAGAGSGTTTRNSPGGCGCGSSPSGPMWTALLALMFVRRRRAGTTRL